MKTLRKKLESMIVGGEGPSPIEYSVMVILLVAASVTVIAGMRQISHPYISRVPVQTAR
jgi:succinate dehydrogenase hydrophobic anchor subunit